MTAEEKEVDKRAMLMLRLGYMSIDVLEIKDVYDMSGLKTTIYIEGIPGDIENVSEPPLADSAIALGAPAEPPKTPPDPHYVSPKQYLLEKGFRPSKIKGKEETSFGKKDVNGYYNNIEQYQGKWQMNINKDGTYIDYSVDTKDNFTQEFIDYWYAVLEIVSRR